MTKSKIEGLITYTASLESTNSDFYDDPYIFVIFAPPENNMMYEDYAISVRFYDDDTFCKVYDYVCADADEFHNMMDAIVAYLHEVEFTQVTRSNICDLIMSALPYHDKFICVQ